MSLGVSGSSLSPEVLSVSILNQVYRFGVRWSVEFWCFFSLLVVSSAALFLVLERVSGLFWVHFRVILKSDSSLFVHESLFQKHVFRLHETIHFQICQAWVSVLFR